MAQAAAGWDRFQVLPLCAALDAAFGAGGEFLPESHAGQGQAFVDHRDRKSTNQHFEQGLRPWRRVVVFNLALEFRFVGRDFPWYVGDLVSVRDRKG